MSRDVILDILATFENGKPGVYGNVAVLKGDKGGLSYGLFQASRASGTLGKLLQMYKDQGGAAIPDDYIHRAVIKDPSLDTDTEFKKLLNWIGDEPFMQSIQDTFFFERFVRPAISWCNSSEFVYPLTMAVVADSKVHGSFDSGADILARVGEYSDEFDFVNKYVAARKEWLSNHENPLLNNAVYRMEFFEEQIANNNWNLEKPMVCHGITLE